MPSKKTVRLGQQGKAAGLIHHRRLCCLSNQNRDVLSEAHMPFDFFCLFFFFAMALLLDV
jgi:hypothetical protein